MKQAVATIERSYISCRIRKAFLEKKAAVRSIQRYLRACLSGDSDRRAYLALRKATVTVQSHWRRVICKRMLVKMRRDRAASAIQVST